MDLLRVVLASLVGVIAVARAARLVTSDDYPPMVWVRDRWVTWCANHAPDWAELLKCPFCFAPYAAAANLALFLLMDAMHASTTNADNLGTWWWLVNIWAAASYAAAMIVVRDEPPPVD